MRLLLDTHVFLWYITADPAPGRTIGPLGQAEQGVGREVRHLGIDLLAAGGSQALYNKSVAQQSCCIRIPGLQRSPIIPGLRKDIGATKQ